MLRRYLLPQICRTADVFVCTLWLLRCAGERFTIFGIDQGGSLNEDSSSEELFDLPILIWNYALTILFLHTGFISRNHQLVYTYKEHGSILEFLSRHPVRDVSCVLLHLY
jgi:hypothetical protein